MRRGGTAAEEKQAALPLKTVEKQAGAARKDS
jgi:hypothetical protein